MSSLMNLNLPSQQEGASVSGVVFFIIALVLMIKIGLAIVPAYISDYQLNKAIALQLKQSNAEKETSKQFLDNLSRQLSINADYDTKPAEILTFTNSKPGQLAVHKKYDVVNNFFSNVDIVSHFEGDITAADADK